MINAKSILPKRDEKSHKGNFGRVFVIGGSQDFPGAPFFCAAAAYKVGAGLLRVAVPKSIYPVVASKIPEATFLQLSEKDGCISEDAILSVQKEIEEFDVLVVGPGLGLSKQTKKFLKKLFLIKSLPKTVVDADGLNFLSGIENFWEKLKFDGVLTPHPGEMGRLTKLTPGEVQESRVLIAKASAEKWKKTIVLKGAESIVCSAEGRCEVFPFKNPLLATAGTGDILTGMIAGFLAQGAGFFESSLLGVYFQGMAGEKLKRENGERGLLASELLAIIPKVIKESVESK